MAENETHPSVEHLMDQLREELRKEIRTELRAEVAAQRDRGSSRRQVLRRGGVAIGTSLAAAAAIGRPAAAADGSAILQSQYNSGTGTTTVATTGAGETALYGYTTASLGTAVRGDTLAPDGEGVVGATGATGTPIGVLGASSAPEGRGVIGRNLASTGSSVGVAGETDGAAGAGVFGTGPATDALGVWGDSTWGTGVAGTSAVGIGGRFDGGQAALRLLPSGFPPPERTEEHREGELCFDLNHQLWVCTTRGTPGTWRRLTTPPLVPVSPFRVYDSRFSGGRIATGQQRSVSVEDAIDVTTGQVLTTGAVPDGTSAIAFNITVTSTVGRGFLSVTPGDATKLSASTINWGATGNVLANGTLVTLDSERRVKVFAGGPAGSSTQFVIDVTGVVA